MSEDRVYNISKKRARQFVESLDRKEYKVVETMKSILVEDKKRNNVCYFDKKRSRIHIFSKEVSDYLKQMANFIYLFKFECL